MSDIVITIADVEKDGKPSISIGIKFNPPPKDENDFTPAQLLGIGMINFIETNKDVLAQVLNKPADTNVIAPDGIIVPKMHE